MKRFDKDFLEKTDVKNIIEYIKNNGLDKISEYDVNSITDSTAREFFDSMLEFSTDYVNNEKAVNYSRARTDIFKKRYDKFLMCYDVLLKNDLVTEEIKKLKETYDRIMLNKVNKLIKQIKALTEEQAFERQEKLEALERIMESINLSTDVVSLNDEHQPLLKISKDEFEKLRNGAIKQKQDDDKKLEDTSLIMDVDDEPKKEDNQNTISPTITGPTINPSTISFGSVPSPKTEKKSKLDKRLESLKIQLIPEEEIQKLKQETEILFESITKANKEGNNPQLVSDLYAKYKESKTDLELAIDNNEKVNKKIARLEGAKKIASLPRKEFNKLKTNAKLKAAEIRKQIHNKIDPIAKSVIDKATDAKDFVVDKATDAKDFVVDKATDAKEFIDGKVENAVNFVSEKKDDITNKIVTGYNNVGIELQNKVDTYSVNVKSQEQLSSDAISEALSNMGNEVSISQIDNAVDKITKEAAKDSRKAERKVALFGALQKLHSIPKALKDAIKSKANSMNEQKMNTGRTI